MASRTTFDLLVQRSAYEVFAALGVSIAPTPYGSGERRATADDLIGVVQLTLNGARASLSLCVSARTLEGPSAALGRHNIQDCLREVVNQLAGRIKNRLARYQVGMDVGLPTVFTRSAHSSGGRDFKNLAYVFRTLTEDVQVELSKHFSSLELRYGGTIDIAEEGDVILF
jgi:CheY-specific phosphatase CheX